MFRHNWEMGGRLTFMVGSCIYSSKVSHCCVKPVKPNLQNVSVCIVSGRTDLTFKASTTVETAYKVTAYKVKSLIKEMN